MLANFIVSLVIALGMAGTTGTIDDSCNGSPNELDRFSYESVVCDDVLSFSRDFDYEIDSYIIETNNIDILDCDSIGNTISLILQLCGMPLSHFSLSITFINGSYQTDTYSVYSDLGMAFVSSQSDESAWCLMATYALQKGIYSRFELDDMYKEFVRELLSSDDHSINPYYIMRDDGSIGNNTTTNVCGTLQIKDSSENSYPLKNIQVALYVDGSNRLDGENLTTTTNEYGYFIFYLTKGTYPSLYNSNYHDYYITFYTKGSSYNLVNGWDSLYSITTETEQNHENAKGIDFSYTIEHNLYSDTSKAFSACCGFGYGEEFAKLFNKIPSGSRNITYVFPSAHNYSWTFKTIGAISDNSAFNFATTLHEYGHYIEQINGAFGRTLCDLIKGIIQGSNEHDQDEDLAETNDDKEVALKMAWDESLADVYSMMVCNYYGELSSTSCSFTGDIKALFRQANDYSMISESSGETQQFAIITYLWNLFSDSNERDSISFSEQEFLDITFVDGIYTLSRFVNNFENLYKNLANESASILEECGIAPKIVSASYINVSKMFKITFIPNGSKINTNNLFNFLFYDENGNFLDGIYDIEPTIESNREKTTYSNFTMTIIPMSSFRFNDSYYVSIEGYNELSSISAPYHSAFYTLTVL